MRWLIDGPGESLQISNSSKPLEIRFSVHCPNISKRNDVKYNNLYAPTNKLKIFKEFTDLQGIRTNQMVEQGNFDMLFLVIGKLGRENH